jgi:hypothetical protein
MIMLKNEVINFINAGVRSDFEYYGGSDMEVKIQFEGAYIPADGPVAINILYQKDGEGITTSPGTIAAGLLTFQINAGQLELYKALNYWIECFDAAQQILFYGSFTKI